MSQRLCADLRTLLSPKIIEEGQKTQLVTSAMRSEITHREMTSEAPTTRRTMMAENELLRILHASTLVIVA